MAEQLEQKVEDLTIAEPHPEPVDGEKTADTPAASQVRAYDHAYTYDANRIIIGRKEEEKEEEEEACSKSRKQQHECREQNDR